jgi:hypothetical protein
MLKDKRSKETATPLAEDRVLLEPTAPESAWDELGGDVNDADLNQWIDELWKTTSPDQQESFSALFPTLPVAPTVEEKIALFALQKQHKLTVTLLYVSIAVAFVIGIVVGISMYALFAPSSRFHQHVAGEGAGANEITGTLYYLNKNGERQADVDAVIICLPKDRSPSPLFHCQGLRPGDALNNDTVQLILELGGMYARADANGSFTLQYREGVRYFVILISANQMQPGSVLNPGDIQKLQRYFRDTELLNGFCVNTDEYEWLGGKHSLRHTLESTE